MWEVRSRSAVGPEPMVRSGSGARSRSAPRCSAPRSGSAVRSGSAARSGPLSSRSAIAPPPVPWRLPALSLQRGPFRPRRAANARTELRPGALLQARESDAQPAWRAAPPCYCTARGSKTRTFRRSWAPQDAQPCPHARDRAPRARRASRAAPGRRSPPRVSTRRREREPWRPKNWTRVPVQTPVPKRKRVSLRTSVPVWVPLQMRVPMRTRFPAPRRNLRWGRMRERLATIEPVRTRGRILPAPQRQPPARQREGSSRAGVTAPQNRSRRRSPRAADSSRATPTTPAAGSSARPRHRRTLTAAAPGLPAGWRGRGLGAHWRGVRPRPCSRRPSRPRAVVPRSCS